MSESVPIGYTDNPRVFILGVDAGADQCEVCGDFLQRLQLRPVNLPDRATDYEPTGPWFEPRQHQIGQGMHYWWQKHNCVKPEPDQCPFCEQAERLDWPRPWAR